MTVMTVMCVNIPHSFEEMVQWGGQASCDGSGRMLVVYGSKDLKRVSGDEQKLERLDPYTPSNEQRNAPMVKQIKCHDKLQAKMLRGRLIFSILMATSAPM